MATNKSFPHLCYILVCESITQREDGRLDVEGVLSRLIYFDMRVKMPPFRLPLRILVCMYSDDETATHEIRYTLVTPDGHESDLGIGQVGYLDGQYRPIVESGLDLAVNAPGTYSHNFGVSTPW
ncbi:MAG TPA: hypothetical protein VF546_24200 [Pyrinomonadaceae bacterium]|jgi:hypothetical protein